MADLKPIRLTYLWADEHVMLKDFAGKISSEMTNWTREFYNDKGFSVDVDPPFDIRRSGAFQRVKKYALKKDAGVRPDMDLQKKLLREEEKAATIRKQMAVLEPKIKAHEPELKAKQDAVPATGAKVLARTTAFRASPTQANLDALTQALDESTALQKRIAELLAESADYSALERQYYSIVREVAQREIEGDYETQLRAQMALKSSKDRIGSQRRLNIVFCDFLPEEDDPPTSGITRIPIEATVKLPGIPFTEIPTRIWLWPYSFIIVNLKAQRRTIAHEIIHAADPTRIHPTPEEIAEIVARRPHPQRRPSSSGSILGGAFSRLEYLAQFEKLSRGFFDGKSNDIMNYSQRDKEPSDYILEEKDKKLLERAFFVEP